MLIRLDTLQPWRGEPVNQLSYQSNIETLWSVAELAAAGFVVAKPFVPASGQEIVPGSTPTYATDGTETYPTQAAPVIRPRMLKSVIVARLKAANLLDAAAKALVANPDALIMWAAADQPSVYSDDAGTIALLKSVGADPSVILAP